MTKPCGPEMEYFDPHFLLHNVYRSQVIDHVHRRANPSEPLRSFSSLVSNDLLSIALTGRNSPELKLELRYPRRNLTSNFRRPFADQGST